MFKSYYQQQNSRISLDPLSVGGVLLIIPLQAIKPALSIHSPHPMMYTVWHVVAGLQVNQQCSAASSPSDTYHSPVGIKRCHHGDIPVTNYTHSCAVYKHHLGAGGKAIPGNADQQSDTAVWQTTSKVTGTSASSSRTHCDNADGQWQYLPRSTSF